MAAIIIIGGGKASPDMSPDEERPTIRRRTRGEQDYRSGPPDTYEMDQEDRDERAPASRGEQDYRSLDQMPGDTSEKDERSADRYLGHTLFPRANPRPASSRSMSR